MLHCFFHFLSVALLLSSATGVEPPTHSERCRPNQDCCAKRSRERLSPDAVLDKIARERGLNKADCTIRYEAPYYVIEPKLKPHEIGGGSSFKADAVTGEIVEAFFTE